MTMAAPSFNTTTFAAEFNPALFHTGRLQQVYVAAYEGMSPTFYTNYNALGAASPSAWEVPTPPPQYTTPAPPHYGGNVTPDDDHKPILAERFKTKMCRSYERTGSCPYVHRCMFAHGDHELRNKDMNLADGLVTEEAIKLFKRATYEAVRAAAVLAGQQCSTEVSGGSTSHTGTRTPLSCPATPCVRLHYQPAAKGIVVSDVVLPPRAATPPKKRTWPFRHDPYTQKPIDAAHAL
jgi:hypothetical protein